MAVRVRLPSPSPTSPSPSPSPTAVDLLPAADAFIDSSYPLASFGGRDRLRTRGGSVINGLVSFTVPDGADISRATLSLYSLGSGPGITVCSATTNWSEATVNWAGAPLMGATVASSGPIAANSWVSIDVTSYLASGGKASFYLTNDSTTVASFGSKEGAATLVPKLRITTN